MKFILLSVFILIAAIATGQDCKGFLPYNGGAKWEITNYNAKGKTTGKVAYELVKKENTADGLKFSVSMVSYDAKDKEVYKNSYEAYCKKGEFTFDMKQFMQGESMQMFGDGEVQVDASEMEMPKMSTPAGTNLKDASLFVGVTGGIGLKMTVDVTDRKVEGKEEMETPAGKFNCIVISQLVSTKMLVKVNVSSKEWYAEGVGMVASESYNKKGKLMGSSKLTKFSN